jgi:hypothetical protein
MKFKSDIELQAGLKDSSGAIGTLGQLLSSTATGVSWTSSTGFVTLDTTQTITGVKTFTSNLLLNAAPITGRESLLVGSVSDNLVDKFILANGTTTSSRFIPTFVGYTEGDYQSLLFRGLSSTSYDLSSTPPYIQFLAANTNNSTDPNNGVLSTPSSRDLFSWSTTGGTDYMKIAAGGNVLIGISTNSGDKLQINGNVLANGYKVPSGTNAQILAANGTVITAGTNITISGGTISASGGGVTSVFGRTGVVIAVSGDYNTSQVTENTNLYFTNARSRSAISLTTTGTSGAATYNSTTGVLNVPNYTFDPSGYLPLAGGTMTGNINWAQTDRGLTWAFNTDGAYIKFFNTGDSDIDSRLEFATLDNNNEYFRWGHIPSGGSFYESMRLSPVANGDAQLVISGNVGIGTTTALSKLDVRGELYFPNISTIDGTNVISFSEVTDKAFSIKAYLAGSGATGNKMGIGSDIAGWASNIMTWRGDGNVGIGTVTPPTKLTVFTAAGGNLSGLVVGSTNGLLNIWGGSTSDVVVDVTNGVVNGSTATNLIIRGGGTERMRITSGGNVGIGVVPKTWGSLNTALQLGLLASIYDSSGSTILGFNTYNDGTANKYIASGSLAMRYFMNGEGHTWQTAPSGTANANITYTDRMRITSGGNVLIGTTTDAGYKLDVSGTSRFVGNMTVTGTITASGGFFNSDIKLKDLTDYEYNASDIKPISYLWKDGRDDKKHVGYSAQEVQKVMPDAVNEGKDGMLSVNYIEVLVAKIAELENRIKQLEK